MRVEEEMESPQECNTGSMIPWSSETNWVVAQGSLENSISIESTDFPISDYDLEDEGRRPPLVLKSPGPDSGPCEIKMHFRQKYDIFQIYVRSSARVFEIYYAHSPASSIEYLSTVRCGVAERDGKLLQTIYSGNTDKEHGESLMGELADEIIADGRNVVPGEDGWVKIKAPLAGRSSSYDKNDVGTPQSIQDLYEATAQINDVDPCSSVIIRLLSLQDKSQVYVDEVYVFVDPAESTDSGNEPPPNRNASQSPLMAMIVPTLLQLSKSAVGQTQDRLASVEVREYEKVETEVDAGLEKHEINQNVKPRDLDQNVAESAQIRQSTTAVNMEKHSNPIDASYIPSVPVERALEQLIARVSRVEDIFLRFEEKLLRPIQNMDARLQRFEHQLETRLQQVEHRLEKLAGNSHYSGFSKCTRISAPTFSGSESNSSSFHSQGSDYAPSRLLEPESEKFSCNNNPDLSDKVYIRPSLVVSAPEFSCGEDEDDNDDLKSSKESPVDKPKQTLSVDDALAAALSNFLAAAKLQPSEHLQTTSSLSSVDKSERHCESRQTEMHGFLAAEEDDREPKQIAQILAATAPEFTQEEIGEEGHADSRQSAADYDFKNDNYDSGNSSSDSRSAPSDGFPAVRSLSNDISGLNTLHSASKGGNSQKGVETSDDTPSDLVEMSETQNGEEISSRETNGVTHDDKAIALEQGGHDSEVVHDVLERYISVENHFQDDIPNVSESLSTSLLDYEFPILEVKFTSDVCASTKGPLEALLHGEEELNIQCSVHDDTIGDEDGNTQQISVTVVDGSETPDLLPSNHLLVDVGVSAADVFSNLEDGLLQLDGDSGDQFSLSCPEVIVSLI